MAEQSTSNPEVGKSVTFSPEKPEHSTATSQLETQSQENDQLRQSNNRKYDNLETQNTEESAKQKSGKSGKKNSSKIPVKTSGKQSKKAVDSSLKKDYKSTPTIQEENFSTSSENTFKVGHNRNKSESLATNFENIGESRETVRENREIPKNRLLEKAKEMQTLELHKENAAATEKDQCQINSDIEDLQRKVNLLSEENYELRERLLKKETEIDNLKSQEARTQENIVNKILRKENFELSDEKKQLKLERDRLRHSVTEKQEKSEKLVAGLKEMEDQLLQGKKALEEQAQASSCLQEHLATITSELNQYREKFGKLEGHDGSKRLSERTRSSRSKSLSPGRKDRLESEQDNNAKRITMLQQREAKLLEDRRNLEESVGFLSNKIAELEGTLQKSRLEKRPTNERGSQTELGTAAQLTSTLIQGSHQDTRGYGRNSIGQKGETMRKCRGIVQSLGQFFEELIQNNQDTPEGGSRGRRTTIAVRRASELLQELSTSMEQVMTGKPSVRPDHSKNFPQTKMENPERSKTLWDNLCDEVAQHEFVFDPLSPPARGEGPSAIMDDIQREIKRAERGLQRINKNKNDDETRGEHQNKKSFTKEDATKLIHASRMQTESVVKDLLGKHQDEIRALLENVCQVSPAPTVVFDMTQPENNEQDEATMAVRELECFKKRTDKVESLVLKLREIVEGAKRDTKSAEEKLQTLEEETRQKDVLLQAKSLELRRRHGKTLESEKALQSEITVLKNDKAIIIKENAKLHELCRQKDLQILQKVQEIKTIQHQLSERDAMHQEELAKVRKKVEQAWRLYESVKSRAERRTAEFSEAAEKLKASQGYLLDLWQTLKTVDTVVEANEHDEL